MEKENLQPKSSERKNAEEKAEAILAGLSTNISRLEPHLKNGKERKKVEKIKVALRTISRMLSEIVKKEKEAEKKYERDTFDKKTDEIFWKLDKLLTKLYPNIK